MEGGREETRLMVRPFGTPAADTTSSPFLSTLGLGDTEKRRAGAGRRTEGPALKAWDPQAQIVCRS